MDSGFFGQTYQGRGQHQQSDRCVNLYPEVSQDKKITGFINCPGFSLYSSLSTSAAVRGMHGTANGKLYVVSGDKVQKIVTGTPSTLGTITLTSGPICMSSSDTQVLLTEGSGKGWVIDIATDALTQITDTDFNDNVVTNCFINGYFIVENPGTQEFYISSRFDATSWDALDFSSAELVGDTIIRVFAGGGSGNDLLLLGARSTEIFSPSLDATFPFARFGNTYIEYGIVAAFSIAKMAGRVLWLSATDNGAPAVIMLQGYQSDIVSTHAVNKALQSYSTISNAIGFCYQQEGHQFYVLSFPSENACWVYDIGLNLWHERLGWNGSIFTKYKASGYAFFENKHLIGDIEDDNVFELSLDTYAYGESARRWLRSWQVPKAENKVVEFSNLMLNCDVGVGRIIGDDLYNSSINRFDGRYWAIDFPVGSMAVVVSDDETELTVTANIRSNRHLVGLIWNSEDLYGHLAQGYETKKDCTGSIIGFCADPRDPYDFNITIIDENGNNYFFRLFPYINNSGTLECYTTSPAVTGSGTGRTYAVSSVFPSGLTIPSGQYVYIIDFDNLYQGFNYDGSLIPVTNIERFFISLVTENYGLGANAILADATGENLASWHITGVMEDLVLTEGDIIVFGYTESGIYKTVTETVSSWTGDGTTERYITMANPLGTVTITGAKPLSTLLNRDSPTGDEAFTFTMSNIEATGTKSVIRRANHVQAAHSTQMTTGFDDSYNITPWRQANQIYNLGYRGTVIMYMGASHYYKASSAFDGDGNYKVEVNIVSEPLNAPTVAFMESFLDNLASLGLDFTWSTSLEILTAHIPPAWAQLDYQGNYGVTGYTPTTSFIAPTNSEATTYITNVVKQGMSLVVAAGIDPDFQLGEFWWWDGTYSNFQPCFYDAITVALYKSETGLDAPLTLTNIFAEILTVEETAYCEWLGEKLGQMTHTIRDAVIATYATADSCLLFFSPQIFNDSAPMLQITNFPISYWNYASGKWSHMQIEQYDWVILGQTEKYYKTIDAATITLGYPINIVDYFMGFVPSADRLDVWPNINGEYDSIIAAGITRFYIWAYTQVIRDGMIIESNGHFRSFETTIDNFPHVGLRISNDAGKTWGDYLYRPLGANAEYSTVVHWKRLGRSRARAFELSGQNSVHIALQDVTVDAEVLSA